MFGDGAGPFSGWSRAKTGIDKRVQAARTVVAGPKAKPMPPWRLHDLRRTVVSGMARLGVAPHVADKILNHQSGTISGVAAVYQRHDFLAERRDALDRWGAHVAQLISGR